MSDRKVINKYYPVDYDPTALKRIKKPKNAQVKVRMALPMSMQCMSCGNFMARGSKFNARKEPVAGEIYFGTQVFRFYFRCSKCFQELTMKTDPKNATYVAEKGIKANFQLHVAGAEQDALDAEEKERLEGFDKMKALEQKSLDSLQEMAVNDAIDNVLYLKSKQAQFSAEELHQRALAALDPTIEELPDDDDLTEEDLQELAEMQRVFAQKHRDMAPNAPFLRPCNGGEPSDEDGDEEEDPIALRSRLARERMLKLQETDDGSHEEVKSSAVQEEANPPKIEPSASTQLPKATGGKPLFKMPFAKPVAVSPASGANGNIATATVVVKSNSAPAAVPLSGGSLLTSKKYTRRDDDE